MHLLVLSAFRLGATVWGFGLGLWSQCTFWCSVLSDTFTGTDHEDWLICLNAPFGAQCFPTGF